MTEDEWRRVTYRPLLVAAALFIVAYSWQVIADLHGTAELIARGLIGITWLFFVIDYLVRLSLASPRGYWFRHHVFDLIVVIVPPLKPLRLLQALTTVSSRSSMGTALRSRIAIYGAGAAIILIWVASLAVLDAERGQPGANIETFGEAVWWSCRHDHDSRLRRLLPGHDSRTHHGRRADGRRRGTRRCGHCDLLVVGARAGGAADRRLGRARDARAGPRDLSKTLTDLTARLGDPPSQ